MATKAIKRNSYGSWDEIPFVILGKLVEKQAWFSGTIEYGCEEVMWNKRYAVGKSGGFSNMRIKADVLGTEVRIDVRWDDTYGFDFSVLYPTESDKWHSVRGGKKHYYSNNYEGALKRVRNAMESMEPKCKELKEERDKAQAEQALKEKNRDDIGKMLGVTVTLPNTWSNEMEYKASKNYALCFIRNDDGTFKITDLQGKLSPDEFKQILEVIRNSPRVMADRLTQGK
jgi:hypothetical protein